MAIIKMELRNQNDHFHFSKKSLTNADKNSKKRPTLTLKICSGSLSIPVGPMNALHLWLEVILLDPPAKNDDDGDNDNLSKT